LGGGGVVFKLTPKGGYKVLHHFQTPSTPSGLIIDANGNLYGTTEFGGGGYPGNGVVFKVSPAGEETDLYHFCSQTNCADGSYPLAGVVMDQAGNLYGTTADGGANQGVYGMTACGTGCGVVFKVSPEGAETVLYNFCAQTNCVDGSVPYAGLVLDQAGNLYGTANYGGAYYACNIYYNYGCGVVFKLNPEGEETVLYNFCAQTNCVDGAYPEAGLIFDKNGNLYSTTVEGGANNNHGAVFKLTPKGKETVLYSFCAQTNCTDGGGISNAGLVFDKGNLYGTTVGGGAENHGVAFKLTP
jgi:uncharacterized repeat protein (TIGR03803 family)